MDDIIQFWSRGYFTQAISLFISIIAFLVAINKRKKNSQHNLLILFLSSYIVCQIVAIIDVSINHNGNRPEIRFLFFLLDFSITIIELVVFTVLIRIFILNEKMKIVLRYLPIIFFTFLIATFIIKANFNFSQPFIQQVFTIQAFFLIIPCIFYYIDLFNREPSLELLNEPSFWIVTGLSFFMVCTLPFSIFGEYIMRSNYKLYLELFSIFNIFYCLLFVMIIRSYLCKPQQAR